MALYLDALGQIVVASSMPSGGSVVPAQPSSNLIDTTPWFRSRDDGSIQWHPANYYGGLGETSLLLTGMLSIPVSVVNSSTTGIVPSGGFDNATGAFKVWLGTQDVTALCAFTAGTPNNLTASINPTTGIYSATAMPDAQSYGNITFTASYKGQSLTLTYAVTKAKDGVVGANGANFNINQSSAIFNKSASGVVSPNAGILLTTSYQNISAITGYVWKKGESIINNVNTPIYTVPIDDYTFVTTNSYSCTITGTINGVVGATLTDNITIPMLIDGSSTPTVVLSNENMTFPASNLGFSGISFASGLCEITAYIGTTQLTYSATGGANTFKCTVSATNVTVAGGAISGNKLILPAPTAMSADSAFLDIATTIYDSTATALSGILVSRVTYSLSRAGIKGDTGDAVDFIFVRSALQPATPSPSSGVPSSPIQWYTDVASVPASTNPLWSSVGFKATSATNYTWDTPSRIEGANVAEVSVYTRGVPTTTPTGGTYTFGNASPITSVPTSTGATWSADIPTGTTPVYVSRAVVSAPAGNTTAINITGWSTPVISFQNGADTTAYWISCTNSLKRSTSLIYTPTTVSMSAYSKTGTANPAAYAGRFKVYENGSLTPSYTSSSDQSTYAYTPSANNLTQLKVEVYLAGGTTIKLDEQTIPILQDGSSAIGIVNENNNVTIPTASDGSSSGTYPNSGTTIQVYEGSTALTYTTGTVTSGTFSVSVSQNPANSITLGSTSGNNTTSFIIGNHNDMVTGTNSVSVVFTITAKKSDGTTVTLTEKQTITKAKAGEKLYTWTKYADDTSGTNLSDSPTGKAYIGIAVNQNSPTESTNPVFYTWSKILGDTGTAGISVYTARIYYQPNPASLPSSPTGGTYKFNGNELTAPSPWSLIPPNASASFPTYACEYTFSTNPPTTTINSVLTAGTWSSPVVISQLGSNGSGGKNAVRVFLKNSSAVSANTNPIGNITATGSNDNTWYINIQTLNVGQFQWQCDGIYDPVTDSTEWHIPYLSVFKVDTLEAFTVKTGMLKSNTSSGQRLVINERDLVGDSNEFRIYSSTGLLTASIGDTGVGTWESLFYANLTASTSISRPATSSIGLDVLLPPIDTNLPANASATGLVIASRNGTQSLQLDGGIDVEIGSVRRGSSPDGQATHVAGVICYMSIPNVINPSSYFSYLTSREPSRNSSAAYFYVSKSNTTLNSVMISSDDYAINATGKSYFNTGSQSVTLCDSTYALNVNGKSYFTYSTQAVSLCNGTDAISCQGNITTNGNITAYDGSDKRLKHNIIPIKNPIDKLKQISGYTFTWNDDYYAKQNQSLFKQYDVGVIAQEIKNIIPEAVHEKEDGYLGVDYKKIIPLLIETIKDLNNRLEKIENDR